LIDKGRFVRKILNKEKWNDPTCNSCGKKIEYGVLCDKCSKKMAGLKHSSIPNKPYTVLDW